MSSFQVVMETCQRLQNIPSDLQTEALLSYFESTMQQLSTAIRQEDDPKKWVQIFRGFADQLSQT